MKFFRFRTLSRITIGAVIVLCLGFIAWVATAPKRQAAPVPSFAGTTLNSKPAPAFKLRDQEGRLINPQQFHGKITVLTFFYTHCPDTCPLTAQKLRQVVHGLGAQGSRVTVIAVSTDPFHDTPALARRFLKIHGLPQWHFVLGTYAELKRVWTAYHVFAQSPSKAGPTHTAGMYLIDPKGRERVYLDDSYPAVQISQDLRMLLGDRGLATAPPVAPQVGDSAPNFNLASIGTSPVKLDSLRSKAVLVNFWATWCIPCKSEMPLLERTYRRYRGRLQIVGIDQQETRSAVRDFIKAHGITYPIGLDQNGNVAYAYEIVGTPTSFLLDKRGVIRYERVGALKPHTFARELSLVMSSKS